MMPNKRQKAEQKGRHAELFAALVLVLKGFRICKLRYKTKVGEVDIIARRGDLILLVEVKARPSLSQAHEAITMHAARRIEAAGDIWLSQQQNSARFSIRRDLVAVLPYKWPIHIANAF